MQQSNTNAPAINPLAMPILMAISSAHFLNDAIQSLVSAVYPILKDSFELSFFKIGLITFVFQLASSIFQPIVGYFSDKRPMPYGLAIGMLFSFLGIVLLSQAWTFELVLLAVALIGTGSSIFHPEASKITFLASGGRRSFAQSVFQVGGNLGSALGPLLAALIIAPYGQGNILWFGLIAFVAVIILFKIGKWYKPKALRIRVMKRQNIVTASEKSDLPRKTVVFGIIILLTLIFSKFVYTAGITSYYTFYLIDKFNVTVQDSQIYLFIYLFAVASGTLIGGALGDRFGRKKIIWMSILGAVPFALALPHLNLIWTIIFSGCIGFIISSAFPAIIVYATELLPGKVGTISGLFYGFAFGIAGLGSALLGQVADNTSIEYVFSLCAYLPLLGFVALLLPKAK